jgi:hypothetical protein
MGMHQILVHHRRLHALMSLVTAPSALSANEQRNKHVVGLEHHQKLQ